MFSWDFNFNLPLYFPFHESQGNYLHCDFHCFRDLDKTDEVLLRLPCWYPISFNRELTKLRANILGKRTLQIDLFLIPKRQSLLNHRKNLKLENNNNGTISTRKSDDIYINFLEKRRKNIESVLFPFGIFSIWNSYTWTSLSLSSSFTLGELAHSFFFGAVRNFLVTHKIPKFNSLERKKKKRQKWSSYNKVIPT